MSTFYTPLLSKSDFSFALLLVTFEPLDIQQSYIPLLKALKCGINAVGAQGSGCMFTLCHAPKKMAVLLHKTENVCRVMNTAVYLLSSSLLEIWVATLSRQISPESPQFLIQSFLDATKYGYGYICMDFRQETNDLIRCKTKILPNELPVVVYVKKKW